LRTEFIDTRALVVSFEYVVCLNVALSAKRDLYGVAVDESAHFRQLERTPFDV
jgi:hypothetical protein